VYTVCVQFKILLEHHKIIMLLNTFFFYVFRSQMSVTWISYVVILLHKCKIKTHHNNIKDISKHQLCMYFILNNQNS